MEPSDSEYWHAIGACEADQTAEALKQAQVLRKELQERRYQAGWIRDSKFKTRFWWSWMEFDGVVFLYFFCVCVCVLIFLRFLLGSVVNGCGCLIVVMDGGDRRFGFCF